MADGSSFNGLYSKCYLEKNPLEPNPGCPMISTLEYFGYAPKRAGWKGKYTNKSNICKNILSYRRESERSFVSLQRFSEYKSKTSDKKVVKISSKNSRFLTTSH